jgi:Tc toxin complex TcA C-terminal TcB-binding domain/Neuraminidase-like domain/Salmonella virulence plasmid 28.1kDa A protein/Putative peptidoglycan binding domain
MILTGRPLRPNTHSDEVLVLQSELRRLGFTITDKSGFFGRTTRRAVEAFQTQHNLPGTRGLVDAATARALGEQLTSLVATQAYVRGRVIAANSSGLPEHTVRAFAVTLGNERLLGSATTDVDGGYMIRYPVSDESIDLLVRVFRSATIRTPLITSPLVLDASREETLNLAPDRNVFHARSEFDDVADALDSVLEGREPPSPTDARSIILLSRATGVSSVQVGHLLNARRMADDTGIGAPVFYALFHGGLPSELSRIADESDPTHRALLERAINSNIIDRRGVEDIDRVIAALHDAIVEGALTDGGGGLPTNAILATTSLSNRQKQRFLSLARANTDPLPDFWRRLRGDSTVGAAAVGELQLTLQLAAITLGHAPLIAAIRAQRAPRDARELAGLERHEWRALVADIEPPAAFTAGEGDPRDRYAEAIAAVVAKAFPTARLLQRWNRDPELGSDAFRRFAVNNPEFEARDTSLRNFLAAKPSALAGIADPERFVRDLEGLLRVSSVVGDDDKFDSVRPLWQNGVRSAHGIVRTGHAAFARRFTTTLGRERVNDIFARARKKTAASLATVVNFSPLFGGTAPIVFANLIEVDPTDEIPDWRTLFGSIDFCDCSDCRSLLSPAAYFVDLLQFLQTADAGDRNALDALLDHRPDLAHIRLDCANSNTVLPYIDLVNEVLENAVVHGAFSLAVTPARQTTVPSAELLANPQYITTDAYDILAEALLPWSLPFNLWHEERKTYLAHLGIHPSELMDVFHREGEPPEPIDRAAATLGLTRLQREIVTGAEGAHGLGTTTEVVSLLRHSQTTFEELTELLTSRFVNPSDRRIAFEGESCALEDARLNLTQPERDRLHRFRRCQKATGWSVFDLDLAIEQVGQQRLDEAFIIQLAALNRIKRRCGVPIRELVAWWGPTITTRREGEDRSLYEELFLNLTVNNPLAPVETIFGLNTAQTELAATRALFDSAGNLDPEVGPLLVGALRINEAEVRLLIDRTLPEPELSLASLSHLFRVASFSRAIGVAPRDYLTLSHLMNDAGLTSFGSPPNTLQRGTPEATWRWIEAYDALRAAGLTLDELSFLLAHRFSPAFTGRVTDERAALLIAQLRTELTRLRPFGVLAGDAPTDPKLLTDLSTWLEQILGSLIADASEGLRILAGESLLSAEEQTAIVNAQFAAFIDPAELLGRPPGFERLSLVYERAAAFLSRTAVIQHLAAAFGFNAAIAERMLTVYLDHPDTSGAHAIDVFLEAGFTALDADPDDPTQFSAAYATLTHLGKLALIVERLSLIPREIRFVFEQGPSLGWYDLRQLPLTTIGDADPRLSEWRRLSDAFAASLRAVLGTTSIVDILLAAHAPDATREDVLGLLSAVSAWEIESLRFLAGDAGYAFQFPEDFRNERWLIRLRDAFRLIDKAGVSAAQAWSWNVAEATPLLARNIKSAAKARHSAEQWLTIARPLSDELRIRRRDAMVDRLIERHDEFTVADDLYERLLIDTQMQPCFLTSRIKQAISSAQLFVQRVLFGLERDVRFESSEKAEWEWRSRFRLREAALKVFLFPENYAEPELRDGKSPLFKELEEKLLEEEVTAESVERACLAYLRGLDEVSRLEIMAHFEEGRDGGTILHIFGRTRGRPHTYYYRRWIDGSYFTPWEKVDINIEGRHLVPIVFNRRLWLLWAVFTRKHEEPPASDLSDEKTEAARQFWEIGMSWSEYHEGRWASPKTSANVISTLTHGDEPFRDGSASRFYVWARVIDGSLRVYPFFNRIVTSEPGATPEDGEIDFTAAAGGDPADVIVSSELDRNQLNAYFCFEGCSDEPAIRSFCATPGETPPPSHLRRHLPYRATRSTFRGGQGFPSAGELSVFSDVVVDDHGALIASESRVEAVLNHVEGRFVMTPAHQYLHFESQAPFFFEDARRTYFVVPEIEVTDSPNNTHMLEHDNVGLQSVAAVTAVHLPPRTLVRPAGLTVSAGAPFSDSVVFTPNDETLVLSSPSAIDMNRLGTRPVMGAKGCDEEPDVVYPPIRKTRKRYRWSTFYHPHTNLFIEQLNRFGVDGLLKPAADGPGADLYRQLAAGSDFSFGGTYAPTTRVRFPHPHERIDFSDEGAYSDYNWEVFFHLPLLIASRLSHNQQFEAAQRWFHYIFDPTETDDAGLGADERFRRFWKIKPFFEQSNRATIAEVLRLISEGDGHYEDQVQRWEADPFDPHLVARMRVTSYMKLVVMKYLDNLIAWADALFRQDTIESINEATQLYVLAGQILGRRPVRVKRDPPAARTFEDLQGSLDVLSNAVVTLENRLVVTPQVSASLLGIARDRGSAGRDTLVTSVPPAFALAVQGVGASAVLAPSFTIVVEGGTGGTDSAPRLYFCPPHNEKLVAYWDVVGDRLFKIRHCMNIEGVERTLALFEPPIDPALLVKAAAAGVDLTSALDDLGAPLPLYRFSSLVQRATEFCNDVKALGASLLSVLEKKDAEALSLLRSRHEIAVLRSVRAVKERAIEEARESLASVEVTQAVVAHRQKFYADRERLSETEADQQTNLEKANIFQLLGQGYDLAANIAHLIPDFKGGMQGWAATPEVTFTFGGSFMGQALQAYSKFYTLLSSVYNHKATMAAIDAGNERREEEWDFQRDSAALEMRQLDAQIAAARIRVAIAERDLENHNRQIEQASEVDAFFKDKFTNEQRYGQLLQETAAVYFQSYKLAYDLAKRAERAYRFELAIQSSNFIQFGYWDNLKKGLMSGERLHNDLRRIDAAYLEQNRREYEITKHISLAQLDPRELLLLKQTGECAIVVPELLFDLDYPGHYLRRIKTASLTIPCVTGPYTGVHCTLTMLGSSIRQSAALRDGAYVRATGGDDRFVDLVGSTPSIATSHGQNDSGMFELVLRDDRYLPFEGAGAISSWRLELPRDFPAFRYDTMTDVVLHLKYTSRAGGTPLREAARAAVRERLSVLEDVPLARLLSLKQEFPNAFHRLVTPPASGSRAAEFAITEQHFPFFVSGRALQVSQAAVLLKGRGASPVETSGLTLSINDATVQGFVAIAGTSVSEAPLALTGSPLRTWTIEAEGLSRETVDDVLLLVRYALLPA